jgi:hypothetical protein
MYHYSLLLKDLNSEMDMVDKASEHTGYKIENELLL